MAVPTADQRAIIEWTGSFNVTEHEPIYDELGNGYLVALSVLRSRRAQYLCGPAEAAVDGDYSQDYTNTLKYLDGVIAELEILVDELGLSSTSAQSVLDVGTVTLGGVRNR